MQKHLRTCFALQSWHWLGTTNGLGVVWSNLGDELIGLACVIEEEVMWQH